MKGSRGQTLILLLISLTLFACSASKTKPPRKPPEVTVAPVQSRSVTLTDRYLCQFRADHHIEVRAPETGYLESIDVDEHQMVKQDDVLFHMNYKKIFQPRGAASDPVAAGTNLTKVRAGAEPAAVELGIAPLEAPFDGMVGAIKAQVGSVIQKGEVLTTLSDNDLMRAYFPVSEARYLEFKASMEKHQEEATIELMLRNGKKFDHLGKLDAIGTDFNAETGTVSFRADFQNPEHVLRHGQTGTLLISRIKENAIVVPQAATFEISDKRYVYVVDKNDIAHRREISISNETDDLFVIRDGLQVDEVIIVDGCLRVHDGEKIEHIDQPPKDSPHQKSSG